MEILAKHIDPDLLPQLCQELSEIIGLDATLKLVKAYPGVRLYIPANPHPDHPIAQAIGFDALCELAKVYGQETLLLPKLDAAERQIKHQMVASLTAQNHSVRTIALAVGYSTRRVEQLRSRQQRDDQPDLFDD